MGDALGWEMWHFERQMSFNSLMLSQKRLLGDDDCHGTDFIHPTSLGSFLSTRSQAT